MTIAELQMRSAVPGDVTTIAALAMQVFLDTYATDGVKPELAVEAFTEYGTAAFAARLREPNRRFFLSEENGGLIGFAEIRVAAVPAPVAEIVGAELVRLYVQPKFQRCGVGARLLQKAEQAAVAAALDTVWLTAWEGNHRARSFYASLGYRDVGAATYEFQGTTYVNRVFAKLVGVGAGVGSVG